MASSSPIGYDRHARHLRRRLRLGGIKECHTECFLQFRSVVLSAVYFSITDAVSVDTSEAAPYLLLLM